jgi:KDO2-lipid IV(A) lauroyltransferase
VGSPDGTPRRPVRAALLRNVVELLADRLERLEWTDAQRIGSAIGTLGWQVSRRDRSRALAHLAVAFPELDAAARTRLGRASFRHLGTILTECVWLADRGAAEVAAKVELVGWERIEAARDARRPVVVVSGHCGNWELIHAALNARGLGMAVIARGLDETGLHPSRVDLRARFGTETITRGSAEAARALRSALRATGALALLIDQDTRVESVFVDFFGRPAWTPVGAATIALRMRATTFPTFSERLPSGTHRVTVEPPLELPTDPVAATQALTARIEAQIRRVPEQWVWMHRRWRRQPEPGLTRSSAVPRGL